MSIEQKFGLEDLSKQSQLRKASLLNLFVKFVFIPKNILVQIHMTL